MKVELINIAKTPLVHKKNMVFQRRHGIKAVKEEKEEEEFLDKVKRRRNKDVME